MATITSIRPGEYAMERLDVAVDEGIVAIENYSYRSCSEIITQVIEKLLNEKNTSQVIQYRSDFLGSKYTAYVLILHVQLKKQSSKDLVYSRQISQLERPYEIKAFVQRLNPTFAITFSFSPRSRIEFPMPFSPPMKVPLLGKCIRQGELSRLKKSDRFVDYVVSLHANCMEYRYKSSSDGPKTIKILHLENADVQMLISSKIKNCFQVIGRKIWTFRASSKTELQGWLGDVYRCLSNLKEKRQVRMLDQAICNDEYSVSEYLRSPIMNDCLNIVKKLSHREKFLDYLYAEEEREYLHLLNSLPEHTEEREISYNRSRCLTQIASILAKAGTKAFVPVLEKPIQQSQQSQPIVNVQQQPSAFNNSFSSNNNDQPTSTSNSNSARGTSLQQSPGRNAANSIDSEGDTRAGGYQIKPIINITEEFSQKIEDTESGFFSFVRECLREILKLEMTTNTFNILEETFEQSQEFHNNFNHSNIANNDPYKPLDIDDQIWKLKLKILQDSAPTFYRYLLSSASAATAASSTTSDGATAISTIQVQSFLGFTKEIRGLFKFTEDDDFYSETSNEFNKKQIPQSIIPSSKNKLAEIWTKFYEEWSTQITSTKSPDDSHISTRLNNLPANDMRYLLAGFVDEYSFQLYIRRGLHSKQIARSRSTAFSQLVPDFRFKQFQFSSGFDSVASGPSSHSSSFSNGYSGIGGNNSVGGGSGSGSLIGLAGIRHSGVARAAIQKYP